MLLGNEFCDDKDTKDNMGCTDDCIGILIGWTCDPVGSGGTR